MLTMFGKKKKDEGSEDKTTENAASTISLAPSQQPQASVVPSNRTQTQSSSQYPSPQSPISSSTPTPLTMGPQTSPSMRSIPPGTPFPEEETSLTRLLRSLVQDIPIPQDMSPGSFIPESTPDFVPLRTTPPSRPMVIGGKRDDGDWEEQKDSSPMKQTPSPPIQPSKPTEIPAQATKPTIPSTTPVTKPSEKPVEKPAKIDKQPEKSSPKKQSKSPQSFDHIFQLTQGNLETSGLVVINGLTGSGRTTLCSGLTGNYMKMGNPCLYLTYDQSPSSLREQMKKLGTDATEYESQFRLIVVDGFTAQSDSFSLEPYYLDQPFSFDNVQDALVRNTGIFAGEKIRVIFDSVDKLAAKVPSKDFTKSFEDLANKLKDAGATFIVTADLSALPKDLAGSITDMANCVVDLSKDDDDPNGRQLQVQRLNQKSSKIDPETFEIDSSKGLVFV